MEIKISGISKRKEKSASTDINDKSKNGKTRKRSNENEMWFTNKRQSNRLLK